MAYSSSATYLLTKLSHAGLYDYNDYNGRQVELFLYEMV